MARDPTSLSLCELAAGYRQGDFTPTEVTEAYLEGLEPGPVYRLVTATRAREQARRAEEAFARGIDLGPLQGVPLALKDLMDTEGEVTAAGSKVLAENPPALADCPAARRLDEAGAVFLGKTTMTELAFSGLGLNPHFGTPANAFDAARLPGGSSSGVAAAVARGLACAAVGSDTGGSVRIPAAYNNLVGLKTTDGSIPMEGITPLSITLDTLGPIARTVEDGWHLWRALSAQAPAPFAPDDVKGLKLLAPVAVLQEGLDPSVEEAFVETCALLETLGAQVRRDEGAILREIGAAHGRYGSFPSLEALALYEDLIEARGEDMDPRVSTRILQFRDRKAKDYIRLVLKRKEIQKAFWAEFGDIDAIVAPTVAVLPPRFADVEMDEAYFRLNNLVLRNTMVFNFLGVPAVSVPAGFKEGLPVGFMIAARPHGEALALSVAHALERRLAL
jgi:aspartyl-tRNA(Asn)/glutamyl-tRNA(Gln) amidotransferase subunit A